MENVAPVETLADTGAISQIVATNVQPVYSGSFIFHPETQAGKIVAEQLSDFPAAPVVAEDAVDLLMQIRSGIASLANAKQRFLDSVLTEYHHKIQAFDDDITELQDKAAAIEDQIRKTALAERRSIKGQFGQAVYASGRVSWDTKGLDGVAVVMPEILKFRKVGEPSVSIRAFGGAK
jgi:hypothetical protein